MTLHLSHPIDTSLLAAMLDDGAYDPAADWLMTNVPEPADVLMLYARDKGACEGIRAAACPNFLEPLFPTDFPQAALAAWAGCVYGPERRAACEDLMLLTEAAKNVYNNNPVARRAVYAVLSEGQSMVAAMNSGFRSHASREYKRLTLRLFPEVVRTVEIFLRDETLARMGYTSDGMRDAKAYYAERGFLSGVRHEITQWRDNNNAGNWIRQTIKAEDFVPVEPRSAPVWSNNRIHLLSAEDIRMGDAVTYDDSGRAIRAKAGQHIVGYAQAVDGETVYIQLP